MVTLVIMLLSQANEASQEILVKPIRKQVLIARKRHNFWPIRILGTNAAFVACDVTKESDISNAVDFTISKYNQLDIMYNNAGVPCKTPPGIVDHDLAVFDKIMDINVRGVMAGIKHASCVMITRQTGSILCTASVTGLMGGLAQHAYCVSKSAVIGIVKSGCRAMQVFPGVDDRRLVEMVTNTGVLEETSCEPNDVANAALYLVSDDANDRSLTICVITDQLPINRPPDYSSSSKKVFILPSLLTLANGWISSQHPTAASLCGIPTLQVSSNKGKKPYIRGKSIGIVSWTK
ncbi:secoisolariciresinol dehydrogenase [Quercus suber]|uniref:Secoisolariciresinol dehydrogenase n=1 Tax=Quercus suber TaxID=58331 RepID=A0AAW0L5L8_QUESU